MVFYPDPFFLWSKNSEWWRKKNLLDFWWLLSFCFTFSSFFCGLTIVTSNTMHEAVLRGYHGNGTVSGGLCRATKSACLPKLPNGSLDLYKSVICYIHPKCGSSGCQDPKVSVNDFKSHWLQTVLILFCLSQWLMCVFYGLFWLPGAFLDTLCCRSYAVNEDYHTLWGKFPPGKPLL